MSNEINTSYHKKSQCASGRATKNNSSQKPAKFIQTNHLHQQDNREMLHRHLDFAALMIVRRGRGKHLRNGTIYGIARGDVYVMGQGTAHQWKEYEKLDLLRKSPP